MNRNEQQNAVFNRGCCSCLRPRGVRKVMKLIFPNLDAQIGASEPSATTQLNSDTRDVCRGKSYLYLVYGGYKFNQPRINGGGNRSLNIGPYPDIVAFGFKKVGDSWSRNFSRLRRVLYYAQLLLYDTNN